MASDKLDMNEVLGSLSVEDKAKLLDSLLAQLNVKPLTIVTDVPKKKRGRPKKVKAEPAAPDSIEVNDQSQTQEEKRIAKASKILIENRDRISAPARKAVQIIKVKCQNCGKETEVASTFPDIDKFVCCVPG